VAVDRDCSEGVSVKNSPITGKLQGILTRQLPDFSLCTTKSCAFAVGIAFEAEVSQRSYRGIVFVAQGSFYGLMKNIHFSS
jgi:hypothetical protein